MGQVVRDTMEMYHGDLVRDGMFIQRHGRNEDYLWMVRATGTHIFCLSCPELSYLDWKAVQQLVSMNGRFFLLGRIDYDEEYFVEITKEEAKKKLADI
jgi:hypothetical protein